MRLELTLNHQPNQVLPINYQYLISSWIYHTLGSANAKFSAQLHNEGFGFGGKKYKLFTFSDLQPAWYDLNKRDKTFILAKSPTKLQLSFFVDEALQHFVVGLFKDQRFSLTSGRYRADFEVSSAEVLPKPDFSETMRFRLVKPLCLSRNTEDEKHAQFLSPIEEDYAERLIRNLMGKQKAISITTLPDSVTDRYTLDFPYHFKLLSGMKEKLYTIKGIDVKGYVFDFELRAPVELMELGWYGGFGERNSGVGMGMVLDFF